MSQRTTTTALLVTTTFGTLLAGILSAVGQASLAADPVVESERLAEIEAGDPITGRSYAQRCSACHSFRREDPTNAGQRLAPSLFCVLDAPLGAEEGFDYSPAFVALRDIGATWTVARLDAFLADPSGRVPGTLMTLSQIADEQDRANVIAYLRTLGPKPSGGALGDPVLLAGIAAADVVDGEAFAARCLACHTFGADEATGIGPNLFDIVGAPVGRAEGFNYSPTFRTLNEQGAIWAFDLLDAFLRDPAVAVPGTRMGFSGIQNTQDRFNVLAYLRILSGEPAAIVPVATATNRFGLNPITFSSLQAENGEAWFQGRLDCHECHSRELRGVVDEREDAVFRGPPLVRSGFEWRWFDGTVFELFRVMRATMPPDEPGGLEEAVYVALLAYILSRNGFAAGEVNLPGDQAALSKMGFFQ